LRKPVIPVYGQDDEHQGVDTFDEEQAKNRKIVLGFKETSVIADVQRYTPKIVRQLILVKLGDLIGDKL
jgi:hypothetical protein